MNEIEDEDLHIIYLTMLKLSGEKIVKNRNVDCYAVFMDINESIGFINIYKNKFTILYRNINESFIIKTIENLSNMGLERERIEISDDYYVFEFSGQFNKLLRGLNYIEKEIKGEMEKSIK